MYEQQHAQVCIVPNADRCVSRVVLKRFSAIQIDMTLTMHVVQGAVPEAPRVLLAALTSDWASCSNSCCPKTDLQPIVQLHSCMTTVGQSSRSPQRRHRLYTLQIYIMVQTPLM